MQMVLPNTNKKYNIFKLLLYTSVLRRISFRIFLESSLRIPTKIVNGICLCLFVTFSFSWLLMESYRLWCTRAENHNRW